MVMVTDIAEYIRRGSRRLQNVSSLGLLPGVCMHREVG